MINFVKGQTDILYTVEKAFAKRSIIIANILSVLGMMLRRCSHWLKAKVLQQLCLM